MDKSIYGSVLILECENALFDHKYTNYIQRYIVSLTDTTYNTQTCTKNKEQRQFIVVSDAEFIFQLSAMFKK